MGRHHFHETAPSPPNAGLPDDCFDDIDGRYVRHAVIHSAGIGVYATACGRIGIGIPDRVNPQSAFLQDCTYCYPPRAD